MKTSQRIWLQAGTDDWDITGDVTWNEEQINDNDIEYVRSDLVAQLEEELAKYKGEWEREEYRCPQCGTGNPKVAQLEAELIESKAYADKLVSVVPFLPKDIEVLRDANIYFAQRNHELEAENEVLKRAWERFKYAEEKSIGDMAHPDYVDAFAAIDTLLLAEVDDEDE